MGMNLWKQVWGGEQILDRATVKALVESKWGKPAETSYERTATGYSPAETEWRGDYKGTVLFTIYTRDPEFVGRILATEYLDDDFGLMAMDCESDSFGRVFRLYMYVKEM